MGKLAKNLDIDDDAFKRIEAIILSMTPYERSHPDKLNASRKRRVAAGSGNSLLQVNQFIRQFEEMRKVMHKMSKQQAGAGGGGMRKPRGSRLGRNKKRR
jgi:signal recognition particle subunit SRP54